MVETRPKRTAAAKAESENKRIALNAMKPMEAQDLQTQDIFERERPAPHKRSSVLFEGEAEATPNQTHARRSSPAGKHAVGTPGSVQVQVVIPQRSSTNRSSSTPTLSRSQSVPPVGTFKHPSPPQQIAAPSRPQNQNPPVPGTFQRPIIPPPTAYGPDLQAQSNNAARNFQQSASLANARKLGHPHPSPQVQGQHQHSAGPDPGHVPVPKPSLIEQVISANIDARQQLQQTPNGNTASFSAAVHPQAANSIAMGFDESGPLHRAMTKTAEEIMTSQAPEIDALAARILGRKISPEAMKRLVAQFGTGQKLQQFLHSQRMGTPQQVPGQQFQQVFQVQRTTNPQPASGQQPQYGLQVQRNGMPQQRPRQQSTPNQPSRQRHHSLPLGRPADLADVSPPKPDLQNGLAQGQPPIGSNHPKASPEAPRGFMPPPSLPRTNFGNFSVLIPCPSQQVRVANWQATVPTTHPRAVSGTSVGSMQPPARQRSNSANSAVPDSRDPVKTGPIIALPPTNQVNGPPSMCRKPQFDYPRPRGLLPANGSTPRPRIKLNFDHYAAPRFDQPEDSDATLSPSPLRMPRPEFDSDATLSPSPVKAPRPRLGPNIPGETLFNNAHSLAEASPSKSKSVPTKSKTRVQAKSQAKSASHVYTDLDLKAPSNLEPLSRQQNLDFGYKPVPLPNPFQAPILDLEQDVEEVDQSEEPDQTDHLPEERVLPQRVRAPTSDGGIATQLQLRTEALGRMLDRTYEDDEEFRLSISLSKSLSTFNLGRAIEQSRAQEEHSPVRSSSKVIPGCLAVTQLPAAIDVPYLSRPRTRREILTGIDDDACVFCNYETSFGISDPHVWLPVEASPGFCNECHEDTQQVFRDWEGPYKLVHGLTWEEKVKYSRLLEDSTTTPLKELGNTLDFKTQQKVEMSNSRRLNAILNASKPCMKDGRKDRREQRKGYNLATSVRNLPRGGKLPPRRAVSGILTRRNSFAADVERAVSGELLVNSQQTGNPVRNVLSTSSPMTSHVLTLPNSNPNQATQTGWINGAPSALPTMSGPIASDHPKNRARDAHGGVITPNSAAFMCVLELLAPPGSAVSASATSSGSGTPKSSGIAFPSPTLSNSSIPCYPSTAPRPASTSAQPTGPPGVPRYFNKGPPGCFLNPPPFNNGPTFCRACPWRLINFTKAKICTTCRDCKFLICSHIHHLQFHVLAEMPGILNGEHKGHGLGKVTREGVFITDGRYSNCMICTGQATHGCDECPLRLCGECVVRLTKMCKGKISELLNFYNQGRDHIRNDAFLLRNDNKGF
ncbi:hypothetical protein BKA65DRAFT_95110 [Rhexocercosporidium sp. MPI-PUGE-AT-0058]|nr:hypothetical protein BKA65DRAFT_95110 [Rhexocercosporidium sp. MPI-PUGE-AT-0058]